MNEPVETVEEGSEGGSNVVWAIGRFRVGKRGPRAARAVAARKELAEILARGYFRLPRGNRADGDGAA